jgi:CheY-specific phosphatase CheX
MHQSGTVMFQKGTKELDICGAAMMGGENCKSLDSVAVAMLFEQGAFVKANLFNPFSTDSPKHIADIMWKSPQLAEDIVQLTLYR